MASEPIDLDELELEVREHSGLGGGQSLLLIREARKLRAERERVRAVVRIKRAWYAGCGFGGTGGDHDLAAIEETFDK